MHGFIKYTEVTVQKQSADSEGVRWEALNDPRAPHAGQRRSENVSTPNCRCVSLKGVPCFLLTTTFLVVPVNSTHRDLNRQN